MIERRARPRTGGGPLVFALCAVFASACAAQDFHRDVPFVPSPQVVVDEMLRLAGVGPQDYVVDLGSGDGRIPITAAAQFGARGLGIELDPHLVTESRAAAGRAGVSERVRFIEGDIFKTEIDPEATVITMYLLPGANLNLRPKLLSLEPGTRIVAHDFSLGEWEPDARTTIRKNVFLWTVPARIAGKWRLDVVLPAGERSYDLELRQKYQELDGIARTEGQLQQPLWEAGVFGRKVRFVIVDSEDRDREASLYFEGRIAGDVMEGEYRRGVGKAQTRGQWRAVRKGASPDASGVR